MYFFHTLLRHLATAGDVVERQDVDIKHGCFRPSPKLPSCNVIYFDITTKIIISSTNLSLGVWYHVVS